MPTRAVLKSQAKAQIKGNLGIMICIYIISGVITATGIGGLLFPIITLSITLIYINMTAGIKPTVADMFKRIDLFLRAWWLAIITQFFTCLWTILLIVPGIIKGLSYSMAPYVLAEHPELTAREALNESKRITKGHIGELFVLLLSFIPWYLLSGITFGILMIVYVGPYMSATLANYYNELKTHNHT